MMASAVPITAETLVEGLITARLSDRIGAWRLWTHFQQDNPFSDPDDFSAHLIEAGIATRWQLERIQHGFAAKLNPGSYVLVDDLGSGSIGSVYRASGRADRRDYAIKILPERSDWNIRQARRLVQTLGQPGLPETVVPFLDVGTSGGMHYLVWPFVDGTSLQDRVRRSGILPAASCAWLGLELASALRACENRGVLHGLLKPTNVLIDRQRQTRLLDFGVGLLLAENAGQLESMVDTYSSAAGFSGMLDCASPELILEPTELTAQCDQYSLGCVLYFALTGAYPFPTAGHTIEKVIAHQSRTPPEISGINPEATPQLTSIVGQMMQKDPRSRFNSWDDVIAALTPLARPELPGSSSELDLRTPAPMVGLRIPEPPETDTPPDEPRRGWLRRWLGSGG